MRVSAVNLYPVKATAGVPVDGAQVQLCGLRGDRRWAVVDAEGHRLNATHDDRLLGVTAIPVEGGLRLTTRGQAPYDVCTPVGGAPVKVDISRVPEARDAGDAAAAWFGTVLGREVRLVWQEDASKRAVATSHGGLGGEPLSLADAGPLLLTTDDSLAQLNEWVAATGDSAPMAMQRFRPNVVIGGAARPFVEDDWREISIGDVRYRVAERCDRCVVTLIDPDTLTHGKEPIRTLAARRKWDGKTWFGIRIVPLETGRLHVGDRVTAG